ncbi:PTS N-acetylmuramic acid transporter subunit IIBC [Jeongeupia wiesaeckerbachi]|uniref:PTS N-acetylmuramic acid transporter subunit IIBC n=1 Tax=Jeongeupia wiesaeckerbachi TaxID=3051218 RepID=UPI003D807EFD
MSISLAMMTDVLSAAGGAGNIARCGNCMTRLRLTLHDRERADHAALRAIAGVLGVIDSDDELQLVLGPGKSQTGADMMQSLIDAAEPTAATAAAVAPSVSAADDLAAVAKQNKKALKAKQGSAIHRFLTKFATIFTPLIPGFIAAGLLLGFATLIDQVWIAGVAEPSRMLVDLVGYMKVFGTGLFAFLGILIGYNTQQAFGGSGVNGAILASLFVLGYDPDATRGMYAGMTEFFGVAIDPRGNIIGILLAGMAGAWVERQVRRVMPDNLDMILTSVVTLLIMGALTFVAIMPLGVLLFDGMSYLFSHLNGNPIGCAVLAGLFLISVMFGVHQGFVPVYFALMETQGFNSLFPILAMAGAGQVGAALALYAKAGKGAMLRTQIKGAIIPGLLGVAEPLIYGVMLPRVKPFITACIGGSVGGLVIGLFAWYGVPVGLNTVFGPSGLVSLPLMTSNQGIFVGMAVYAAGMVAAYGAGFILTLLWGCRDVDLD